MSFLDNIKKFIETFLSDRKIQNSKSLSSRIYSDEPIIQVASHMKNYIPQRIRDMKKLRPDSSDYYALFYKQAKFMEDFEDDFDNRGSVTLYYPTYNSLTETQLRWYFSWRARFRKGIVEDVPLSFVYLHIYELLHMIGACSPEDGFEKLKRIRECYPASERYIKTWLRDYAVYYGLDKSLAEEFTEAGFDDALLILRDAEAHSEDELYRALCELSSYNISRSAFFSEHPDDAKTVICRVYKAVSVSFEKRSKKKSYFEKLFGNMTECSFHIFESAVFYDMKRYSDYEYIVNDIHRYLCKRGSWSCAKYYGNRGKNRELGDIIRTADSVMREKYGFEKPLQAGTDTKYIVGIIEKTVDGFLAEKKEKEKRRIDIDLSKLEGIRISADATRDRLIVDEEEYDIPEETAPAVIAEKTTEGTPETADCPLNENELGFLRRLLEGGDYAAFLKERGLMVSVIADSVNEKLFDIFGDTVIDFDGDKPVLIEDYTDELKGLTGK